MAESGQAKGPTGKKSSGVSSEVVYTPRWPVCPAFTPSVRQPAALEVRQGDREGLAREVQPGSGRFPMNRVLVIGDGDQTTRRTPILGSAMRGR